MGGAKGQSSQGIQRAPTSFVELGSLLQRAGFSGAQQFLGSQGYGEGGRLYGRTADGGIGIGGPDGAYMGYDAQGRFFDRTSYNLEEMPENAVRDRTSAQIGLTQSGWYNELFNNLISQQNAPQTPSIPTIPSSGGGGGGGNPYAGYQAQQEAAAQAAEQAAGIKNRDKLYEEYIKATEATIEDVDSQISRERSSAALMGIQYEMDDNRRQNRLQDYFTQIWAEENQTQLNELMDKYGNPEGFDGWLLTRAEPKEDTGEAQPTQTQSNALVSASGTRKKVAPKEDVDTEETTTGTVGAPLGGRKSLLGI